MGSEAATGGRGLDRAAGSVALGALVSRLLGFARDLLFAFLLGPSADAFLVAFRLPNFFRRLLAEGSLGLAFAAEAARTASGPERQLAFAQSACLHLFLLPLPLVPLLGLAAEPLALLLAPGLGQSGLQEAARCLRFCLPYLPLCLAASIACAQGALRGFFRPQAWSAAALNVMILICAGLAYALPGPSGGPDFAFRSGLLCLGVVLGGLAQLLLSLRCLRPGRRAPRRSVKELLKDPAVPGFLKRLPGSALGAAAHQLHILAGTILASFLGLGGISSLYFAERLVELPLGLIGASIGIAALPDLAAGAAASRRGAFAGTLVLALRKSAFLSLPAAAGLFALSLPITSLLFGRGLFDEKAVAATAAALCGYSIGLPALCAARPLLAAVNGLGRGGATLSSALRSLVVLLGVSLSGLFAPLPFAVNGSLCVALGLSAGAWANIFFLLRALRPEFDLKSLRPILPALGAYLAGAAGTGLLLSLFRVFALGPAPGPALLAGIAACAFGWVWLFTLARNPDALGLLSLFKKRRGE